MQALPPIFALRWIAGRCWLEAPAGDPLRREPFQQRVFAGIGKRQQAIAAGMKGRRRTIEGRKRPSRVSTWPRGHAL